MRSVGRAVRLINCYPPPTAIWRYSNLLAKAVDQPDCLATFCLGNFDFSSLDPRLTSIHGNGRFPRSLTTALNYAVPSLVLSNLTAECRKVLAKGGVLHYLAEDIWPWVRGGAVAVSVHGNPMATLETDRYYKFRAAYRVAVRRNLRAYARCAVTMVQSEYVRRGLAEYGFDGEIQVIPPAVDPIFQPTEQRSVLREHLGLPVDRKILLSISTAERRKNLGILPQVMDQLTSDYLLIRVGPPVRNSVSFGGLSDKAVSQLYAAADVLLFPTLEEGFGLPVIEAFAAGLPGGGV